MAKRKPVRPATRACKQCGKRFKLLRSDTRFCSNSCSCRYSRDLKKRRAETCQGTLIAQNVSPPPESRGILGLQRAESKPEKPVSEPVDDGRRWIDKWGYIHRRPAGNRVQILTPKPPPAPEPEPKEADGWSYPGWLGLVAWPTKRRQALREAA
jgi:hypothetical protein